MRMRAARRRFWVETGLAVVGFFLAAATLIFPRWIEGITGLDPDAGSAVLEWAVTSMLLVVAGGNVVLARAEWRRAISDAATGG